MLNDFWPNYLHQWLVTLRKLSMCVQCVCFQNSVTPRWLCQASAMCGLLRTLLTWTLNRLQTTKPYIMLCQNGYFHDPCVTLHPGIFHWYESASIISTFATVNRAIQLTDVFEKKKFCSASKGSESWMLNDHIPTKIPGCNYQDVKSHRGHANDLSVGIVDCVKLVMHAMCELINII